MSESQRLEFLSAFIREAEVIDVVDDVTDCRDPKDNKFLELALSGRASHIVTGTRDPPVLHPFRGIAIVSPKSISPCWALDIPRPNQRTSPSGDPSATQPPPGMVEIVVRPGGAATGVRILARRRFLSSDSSKADLLTGMSQAFEYPLEGATLPIRSPPAAYRSLTSRRWFDLRRLLAACYALLLWERISPLVPSPGGQRRAIRHAGRAGRPPLAARRPHRGARIPLMWPLSRRQPSEAPPGAFRHHLACLPGRALSGLTVFS